MRRFDELTEKEKLDRLLRVAEKALSAFGLAGDLSFVAQGKTTVFHLRAAGISYAVRVCAGGEDHAPLRRELLWLAALGRDTALAVPEPVLTLTGDLLRSTSMEGVPGTRACMVLRWVEGERREAELSTDEAAAMGRFVAALHQHAEGFRWPEELTPKYLEPASRVVTAADAIKRVLASAADRALLCNAASNIAELIGGLGDGPESVGAIHGDLRLRNLRHDRGSVGALGFDTCRCGAYLDDLSVLWSEFADREQGPELQSSLLAGYRAVRNLPDAVPDALRAFACLRTLESVANLATDARSRRLLPAEATRHVERAIRERFGGLLTAA